MAQYVGAYYLKQSENWIYHQVRHLSGFRSIFLAKRTANLERFPWDPVHSLQQLGRLRKQWNRLAGNLLGYYPFFAGLCRRGRVRLVHAHNGVNGRRILRLTRHLDIPLVTSFYGRDMFFHPAGEDGLRRQYRKLFARGAAFLAEGPAARAQLIRIGCPAEKVHIHRLGIDPSRIPFCRREASPGDPIRVLMAARFVEKKGMPYGVEAFCRAAKAEPRLSLTVVGDAGEGAEEVRVRARLHELVREYGMADRVRFTGFLSSAALHDLAAEHHLFMHPSVHARDGDAEGGHPVVLTEMAASGMPIIATRHCDIPEVVVDGGTGWLCPERSVQELETALREAVSDPGRLARYGEQGRRLVEEKYDVRYQALDTIYQAALNSGGSPR